VAQGVAVALGLLHHGGDPLSLGGVAVLDLGAATIKSHHDVGGLPEDLGFELVEPLRSPPARSATVRGRAAPPAPGRFAHYASSALVEVDRRSGAAGCYRRAVCF
jgi:hypothetical protein